MTNKMIRSLVRALILEASDEDLAAKADFKELADEEQARQLSNFSIYKTLSKEQRTEAAHTLLGVLGLIPIIGEPADLADAILYIQEKKYALAAISFICLIPVIGTAVGVARRSAKFIPAKIIFEHAKEIEALVDKITPVVAGGSEISKAVQKILDNITVYEKSLDKVVVDPITGDVSMVMSAVSPASSWYKNPKMLEWFKKFASESLTDTLNKIGIESARDKFVTKYVKYAKDQLSKNANLSADELATRIFTIDEYAADAYRIFPKIVDSLSSLKIRMSIQPFKLGDELGSYIPEADVIIINLSAFGRHLKDPIRLKNEIVATLDHEVWHAIDDRIKLAHDGLEKLSLGSKAEARYTAGSKGIYGSSRLAQSPDGPIAKLMSAFNIPENQKRYYGKPTEIFVRVRALKKFLNKEDVLVDDLKKFAATRQDKLPNDDLETVWSWLQEIPDDKIKDIADAIDFF